jgi:hypothetical protein
MRKLFPTLIATTLAASFMIATEATAAQVSPGTAPIPTAERTDVVKVHWAGRRHNRWHRRQMYRYYSDDDAYYHRRYYPRRYYHRRYYDEPGISLRFNF